MNCSKCGKPLEEMGQFGSAFSTAASVRGFGNPSNYNMWKAQVCTKCKLVFCGDCIELGRPTPCPQCGSPTEPAYKGTIDAMGALRKLKTTRTKDAAKINEDIESIQFRALVQAKVEAQSHAVSITSTTVGMPWLMTDEQKEEMVEAEVSKFSSNPDPLFRSIRYRQWLVKGEIQKADLANAMDHLAIASIAEELTRSQLSGLIRDYETACQTLSSEDLARRDFYVERGLFKKRYTIRGAELARLMPKLQLMVKSNQWKSK